MRLKSRATVDHSLAALAAHILLTAGSRTLPEASLDGLDRFISHGSQHQAYCADLVSDWIHSDDVSTYVPVAEVVQDEMHLVKRFSKQTVESLADTEVFPCIDEVILTKLMTDIGNEIIAPEKIDVVLEKRRTMVWFDDYKDYYDGIFALSRMQSFFKEHAAGFHLVGAKKIWDAYTKDYYKMDTYYRAFHISYENSKKTYGGTLRKPGRRLPHNVADLLHIRVLRNFDDQFIVDMPADETVFQVLHGITEDVPADRLGDVFDEFRAVGFDERPLFICSDAVIFHAFPAEAVCADPGLHIAEPSAGWKVNKEHAGLCAVS